MLLGKVKSGIDLAKRVHYASLIVQAVVTIVNYDHYTFIVQATGNSIVYFEFLLENKKEIRCTNLFTSVIYECS